MKKTMKLLALVLAVVMTLALSTAAFADATGKITIQNSVNGETYTVYKVFDAIGDGAGKASYKLVSGKTTAPAGFSVDTAGNVKYDGSGTELTAADIAAIAAYVKDDTAVKTGTGTGSDLILEGFTDGYYYITTTAGSVVIVNSTNHDVTVTEKNEKPTVTKEVQEGTTWGESNDAKIGDTVKFKTTIAAKKGAVNYVLHDTMDAGLTFDPTSVVVEGLTAGTHYTLVSAPTDGCTFEIKFAQTYLDTITADTNIVVTYSATLNAKAEISTDSNDNTTKLTYGNNSHTESDTTKTYTYKFELVKTDADDKLITGAKFELYDAATAGNKIALVKESTGEYRPATKAEKEADGFVSAVIVAGKVTIQGLDSATYYLEESEAPAGYNKLTERKAVTINKANLEEVEMSGDVYTKGGVQVVNNAGTILPSTGGVGTTIFYVLGAILLVGAGVLLVTKKRIGDEG